MEREGEVQRHEPGCIRGQCSCREVFPASRIPDGTQRTSKQGLSKEMAESGAQVSCMQVRKGRSLGCDAPMCGWVVGGICRANTRTRGKQERFGWWVCFGVQTLGLNESRVGTGGSGHHRMKFNHWRLSSRLLLFLTFGHQGKGPRSMVRETNLGLKQVSVLRNSF